MFHRHSRRFLFVTAFVLFAGARGLWGQSDAETRASEWESYQVPGVEFRRYIDPTGRLFCRVPAEWQQAGVESKFIGAGAELTAFVETIPDGFSLKAYLAALLQHFQKVPGAVDAVRIRPIELSGLEGREVLIGLFDEQGTVSRRVIWCAVERDTAISFLFVCPDSSAAAMEPYFKAIVQSTVLTRGKSKYDAFTRRIQETGLARDKSKIDRVQMIVSAIESTRDARLRAVQELAALLKEDPEPCLDLFLDRRDLVRGTLYDAVAASGSDRLIKLVYDGLEDLSAWVAERAARCLASFPQPIGTIRKEPTRWSTDILHLLRLFPYLKEQRDRVDAISHLLETGMNTFTEGERSLYFEAAFQLIQALPVSQHPLPVAELIAKRDVKLTRMTLETAAERQEPVEGKVLFGLLSHPDVRIVSLAATALARARAQNIEKEVGQWIARLEKATKRSSTEDTLLQELKRTRRKLEFGRNLGKATTEQRRLLMAEGVQDPDIGDWVWTEFGSPSQAPKGADAPPGRLGTEETSQQAGPFGEYILPKTTSSYAAIPDPAEAFQKLDRLVSGVKMHSTRDQATFAALISAFKELFAKGLGIPAYKCDLVSQGILADRPAVFAGWRPEGAPAHSSFPQRTAVLLSVGDRDRFEQLLETYQQKRGSFAELPVGVAVMTRLVGLFPAIAPGLAQMQLLEQASGEAKGRDKAKEEEAEMIYTTVRTESCESVEIRVFERRRSGLRGLEKAERSYVAYVGEQAVITPDLDSMRDLLTRLRTGQQLLKDSEQFQAIRKLEGEAVYFSELEQKSVAKKSKGDDRSQERGRLVIGPERIENEYHVSFKNESGEQPFLSFQPGELGAPDNLLPDSSIVFFFMRLNELKQWPNELKDLMSEIKLPDLQQLFQLDLEKEVFPELGPECGAALVDMVTLGENLRIPWVVFFALRTGGLSAAHEQGRLFTGRKGSDGSARLKIKGTEFNATIKNGYLVFAADSLTLQKLEDPGRLKDAPDFKRSVAAVTEPVVAFGGVNGQASVRQADDQMDVRTARAINALGSLARAFHSHTLLGRWHGDSIDFRMSVSTDREGAYSVADLSVPTSDFDLAFAVIRAGGVPVIHPASAKAIRLQIRTKAKQIDERMVVDLQSAHQKVESQANDSITLTVLRRPNVERAGTTLPISGSEFEADLRPTREIRPDDPQIQAKAREIAGEEKDAWKVACKLADWVFSNLKWKLVEHRDATETLATKQADCLEFSQLYIALARSLGLPARLVMGFAWSDGSFIGHAWVEVYVGEWVELDPTFGTHSVDAFHVRENSGQLLILGSLNAVQIDVLETSRDIPESQKDARALMEELCRDLGNGEKKTLLAVLDAGVLVSEYLAPLSWDQLSEAQQREFLAAYQTAVTELSSFDEGIQLRLLAVEEKDDRARAFVMEGEHDLLVFHLLRRDGLWNVVDMEQPDIDHHVVAETLKPVDQIGSGVPTGSAGRRVSPYQQVLLKLWQDPGPALALADQRLSNEPDSRSISLLKAIALVRLDKRKEAVALLEELTLGDAYPPALWKLGQLYEQEESEWQRALDCYGRYSEVAKHDPRPHSSRAILFQAHERPAEAEREYREARECDPESRRLSLDLAQFLAVAGRSQEAVKELDRGESDESRELFGNLLARLYDQPEAADQVAAAEPALLRGNADANLHLSGIRLYAGKAQQALAPAREAAKLSPEDAFAHVRLAEILRKLDKLKEARESCEQALKLEATSGFAHYEMACILTRLGNKREAVEALKKAFEEDDYLVEDVAEEQDLKPLAEMPEFIELMKSLEGDAEEPEGQQPTEP